MAVHQLIQDILDTTKLVYGQSVTSTIPIDRLYDDMDRNGLNANRAISDWCTQIDIIYAQAGFIETNDEDILAHVDKIKRASQQAISMMSKILDIIGDKKRECPECGGTVRNGVCQSMGCKGRLL